MITLESLISTVCLDVLNVILVCHLFNSLYKLKNDAKSKVLVIIIALLYILAHIKLVHKCSIIIIDSLMIFSVSLLYEFGKKKRLESIVTILLLNSVIEFFVYYLFVFLFNDNILIRDSFQNNSLKFFQSILCRYILFIVIECCLLRVNNLSEKKIKIFKYISFGVSVFYAISIVSHFREILFYYEKVGRIFIFTLVLYNTVLVIFNYYQNMHIRTVNKLETLKQNRSYQGKYWKDYYENYAAIRKTKHDMLNGYIGLYGLVKEERYDELKLYLESSIKNLKEMESVHYFGNPLIDAIVSKKISDAKERGIEVVFHCGVISIGDIDEEDLGILLANALDNAIESTVKSSYDKIDVYVSTMNCFLKIDVINYVDDITGVSFKNTSKVFDKENHGIGIKSMKDTAKKYNGSLQYDKKDNEVILSVIMNIN